ncbi:class I SAM-dependent methyltransferase [Nocardia harenae]|uniref:class I SAM-dependent methyltransferase n=1 Tax=Nocardia harenae TaxID=358707 RepID=UPI00082DE7DD|nr:class I SAM-dependent methyltransferase [Nocardia harenae]
MLAWLNRVNRAHPWSHNDHYLDWVVRQVRASGARDVLDIGCGTGNLVARLREHHTVTGLERDPETVAVAAARFRADPAVRILPIDFADRDPGARWDAITLVAVLHHLPLRRTLRALRDGLSPGGRIVVVGCHRDTTADLLARLPAVLLNPLVGLVKHPARATEPPPHMRAPVAEPRETLAEIRAAAAAELPGARIRRRLFWRYTLVWDRRV